MTKTIFTEDEEQESRAEEPAPDAPPPEEPKKPKETPFDAGILSEMGFNPDPEVQKAYRKQCEAGVPPVDVGDALLGKVTQQIQVIPKRLSVVFRTLTNGHQSQILLALQTRFGTSVINSPDSSLHQQCLKLACAIQKIQEASILDPLKDDGAFDEKILEQNLRVIRKFPDYIFWKVWFNYTWFCERVIRAVDEDSLRNG